MIGYFTNHPNAANLLMAALVILGLSAVPGMQRETFPQLVSDRVQITIAYPGATAGQAEDAVCRRVEDALEAVNDLEEVSCEALEGLARSVARMREDADISRFLDDVKSAIDAIDDFPDDVELPVVAELGRTEDVVSIALGGIAEPLELKNYAEDLKDRLQRLPLIDEVLIGGFSRRQIRIEVPARRLRQFGLSSADVANAIRRQSTGMPAGRLEGSEEDILLRFDDERRAVDAFRDLVVIASARGAEVRLGDIATISERFELPEQKVTFDARRAALLTVRKNRSRDALDVLAAVRDFVAVERQRAPPGVRLDLTRDRASLIGERLDLLLTNSLQGLVLVFLALWLFFNLRYSFWVVMGLPVSFLGALFAISQLGISLNMISAVGLLIAVGLLMDDAIVIAENIATRMRKGDTPAHAAVAGARQVLPGILSSFATTALILGSVAFIGGTLGQILRVMPIVLLVVLAVSLAEAFLILPNHLSHSLAHGRSRPPARLRQAFERGFESFRDGPFRALVARAVAYPYLSVGMVLFVLLGSVALVAGGKLGFRGFPDVQGDIVEARILLPQGTPLRRTEEVVERVTAVLGQIDAELTPQQPGGQALVRHVAVIYDDNPDAFESGPHVARVSGDLLSAEVRNADLDDVLARWRRQVGELPDVIQVNFTEPTLGPAGRAIDIRLHGGDLAQLQAASRALQDWLVRYAGVHDVSDDLRPGKRELRLHLEHGAGALGLDARAVADQVAAAFQGITVDEFPLGGESYAVTVRLSEADRATPADLEDLRIVGPDGALIPLRVAARVEERRGWARINRVDARRTVTVTGDVDSARANAQAIVAATQAQFLPGLLRDFPGIDYSIEGESRESGETGGSIVRNMLLGLVGVYLLLAFQFRSYLLPLAVMSVIPTGLIGVIWGHFLLGLDLSMPSIMGAASLAGIVVNDSILLIQFIVQARREGRGSRDAAAQAAVQRFRPIFLTSLTTVAGLTPLLLEKSLQAQVLIPLAASLAFGLAAATLVALFLVPALYCVFDDLSRLLSGRDVAEGLLQSEAPAAEAEGHRA